MYNFFLYRYMNYNTYNLVLKEGYKISYRLNNFYVYFLLIRMDTILKIKKTVPYQSLMCASKLSIIYKRKKNVPVFVLA